MTYFSNHSVQSRFLANSSKDNSTTGSTTTTSHNVPATTPTNVAVSSQGTNTGGVGAKPSPLTGRPRAPSSRHFSTSLSTSSSGDEKPSGKEKQGVGLNNGGSSLSGTVHPLRHTWVFWFRQQRSPGNKIVNYEEGIKRISSFASIESFWTLWKHINPPSTVQPTTDYLLFHSGVRRPVWEDPLNLQGGKWIIRLKKGLSERLWMLLVIAVIGDQFVDCQQSVVNAGSGAADGPSWRAGAGAATESTNLTGTDGTKGGNGSVASGNEPEICGCTLSIRHHEDILSVWNKHGTDTRVNQRIKETIKRVLELPPNTILEYKTNNDSMQDKSSFRQPTLDRSSTS